MQRKQTTRLSIVAVCSYILFAGLFSGCSAERTEYLPESAPVEKSWYVLGIHPYLNPQLMFRAYEPILRYAEERVPGLDLRLEASNDYGHYEEKLYAGLFDFALPNPFQTIKSFDHGYCPIGKMYPDDVFRGIIVARKDRNLKDFEQLKGQTISFPAPTALAATMMPLMLLFDHGLDIRQDITKKYVGSQYSSILNAYTGDSFAGCTWPPPWEEWRRKNPEKAEEMELVWQTGPLPNNGFVVRSDVDRDTAQAVMRVLVDMRQDPEGSELLDLAGFAGFEYADGETFKPVLDFLETYRDELAVHLSDNGVEQ